MTDEKREEQTTNESFNPFSDARYIILWERTDSEAEDWLDMINKRGPRHVLRSLLVSIPSDTGGGTPTRSKPWRFFSNKEELGDYTLVWNTSKNRVRLVERVRTDNQYGRYQNYNYEDATGQSR